MLEEAILVYFCIIMFFVVLVVTTIRTAIRQKERFIRQIRKNWGQTPNREYTYEEFSTISHYAKYHKSDRFQIDDITWNDLDMDRIFMLINNTISSCGEEYLYYILREPAFSQSELDERNRLVEFFRNNEEQRMKLQLILREIGKTRRVSLCEYIDQLKYAKRKSNLKYYILIGCTIIAVASFFVNPLVGLLLVLGLLVYNTCLYMSEKSKIESYVVCFRYILNMISAAQKLKKANIPEIQFYTDKLIEAKNGLAGFSRGSFVVTSKDTVSGDIGFVCLEWLKMLFHIDRIKYNSMLKHLEGHQSDVELLMEQWGILDSAIAIASFREYLPYYTRGVFRESKDITMKVENLYHPLIGEPVSNSIAVDCGTLITGSNASGKSTFIKNIAINSILAQTIDTAVATRYESSFLKVMTSMALSDNLEQGESYYIVEIKSLKRILDESEKEEPMLCIVDEVLRGTNTIERIAASSQILKSLGGKSYILPFAATHDLELSYILEPLYKNYHFEEELSEHDVRFSYILKDGRTNTRNAIRLLEIMDYDGEIVAKAREEAVCFENTGEWKLC